MDKFESVDDILEFAIAGEVAANQFYMELAGKMKNSAMAKVFEDFAKEELGHKSKLEAIKQGTSKSSIIDEILAGLLVGLQYPHLSLHERATVLDSIDGLLRLKIDRKQAKRTQYV